MNINDQIVAARYMAEAIKYSVFIYKDYNNNWCSDFLGRTENCFSYDIKEVIGVLYYKDMNFYDAKKIDEWPKDVLNDISRMTNPKVAKIEYEKRITGKSRFEWPV